MDAPSEDAGWASRTASGRSSMVSTSPAGSDEVTVDTFVNGTLCVRGLAALGAMAEGADESSDVRISTSGTDAPRCGRAADALGFVVVALSVAGADPCFDADFVVVVASPPEALIVATGEVPTLTMVLVPSAEVVAGVVVVVSLEDDVPECGDCISDCEFVDSLTESDMPMAPLFPADPAEDADADESLEPAPSSACATPVPVASAAPTPSVMAPAPSHA